MEKVIEDLQWLYKTLDIGGKTAEFYEAQKSIILQGLVALEKQIPKKVVHTHHCPSCDIALPTERITDDYCSCCFNWSYCPWCGQAIKWE